jgi:arylsulfatase A-like enzyme
MKNNDVKQLACAGAFLGMTGIGFVAAEGTGAPVAEKKTDAGYNVLLILADDLGATDLGATGSTFYETPHIDSIAETGMIFTQGYAAAPVCSPSRASLLTGKSTPRHGITEWIGGAPMGNRPIVNKLLPQEYVTALKPEELTLAEALKAAGYVTFIAGKWHLGNSPAQWPEHHGFDINKGGYGQGQPGNFYAPYINPRLKDGPNGEALNLRLGRETADFIEQHKDRRFFAYLSLYAVHTPIQTTREKWSHYREKALGLGPADRERYADDQGFLVRTVQDHPVYAGLVEEMDDSVGIVLDKLKELGLDKNTVVIFTSDNGGVSIARGYSYTSALPLRGGKGQDFEGGVREPFIVRVPGMTTPARACAVPVIGTDLYPTILELAGLPLNPEQHVDGVSLVPLLQGGQLEARDLFWHYPHYAPHGRGPSSWMRSGDWKLIHYWEDGRDALYNLSEDPGERTDLSSLKPEQVRVLRARLDRWVQETGAKIPQRNPNYDPGKVDDPLRSYAIRKANMEKHDHQFFEPDWAPEPREGWGPWWGSERNDEQKKH